MVPLSLRSRVLNKLHSAHQGLTSMHNRAQQIVFWPGITQDIESIWVNCQSCNLLNSPYQPSFQQEASDPTTSPFEQIFADFVQFARNNFLVVGDTLSGWSEILQTQQNLSGRFAWVD